MYNRQAGQREEVAPLPRKTEDMREYVKWGLIVIDEAPTRSNTAEIFWRSDHYWKDRNHMATLDKIEAAITLGPDDNVYDKMLAFQKTLKTLYKEHKISQFEGLILVERMYQQLRNYAAKHDEERMTEIAFFYELHEVLNIWQLNRLFVELNIDPNRYATFANKLIRARGGAKDLDDLRKIRQERTAEVIIPELEEPEEEKGITTRLKKLLGKK